MSEIKGIAERHLERTGHHNAQGTMEYIVSELMPDIEAYIKEKVAEAVAEETRHREVGA